MRSLDNDGKPSARTTPLLMKTRISYLLSCVALIALIALCIAWEARLAPAQPGGSWLTLKCLPLLTPLFGILHGRVRTYQWASMLILLYLVEGCVRIYGSLGAEYILALSEIALSLTFFAAAIVYVRQTRSGHG